MRLEIQIFPKFCELLNMDKENCGKFRVDFAWRITSHWQLTAAIHGAAIHVNDNHNHNGAQCPIQRNWL